uniref:Probable G-protein coupled receptor (inferred by orthology to a C. elegans protein) n=1 Tax=Anisakis simplex TaxID=6269 RepID=A0A0M3JBX2_ANISI
LMRISLYTLAVACFYFLCWTPFWIATVFAVYLEYAGEQSGSVPPVFVYCMYFIHALPFTNSAVNWILYGALNGQLQHRIKGRRSDITTTIYNNGNVHPSSASTTAKYDRNLTTKTVTFFSVVSKILRFVSVHNEALMC